MKKQKYTEISKSNTAAFAKEATRDVGTATIGTLVGAAVGGLPGAIVGAATSPILTAAVKIGADYLHRRRARAEAIVRTAIDGKGISEEQFVEKLATDASKTDEFLHLLNEALRSDPATDIAFAAVAAELIATDEPSARERLSMLVSALTGLRPVQLRILGAIYDSNCKLSASALAEKIGYPEVELRYAVRDLELRGMIKDTSAHPVEWKLRELGKAVIGFVRANQGAMK